MAWDDVLISGGGLLSPTGGAAEAFDALLKGRSGLHWSDALGAPAGPLSAGDARRVADLRDMLPQGARLDATSVMGAVCAQDAAGAAGWTAESLAACGVVIGSSRGPAASIEKFHDQFLSRGKSSPSMSPVTTGVTLAATAGGLLGCRGPSMMLSAACQTALSAIGVAWSLLRTGQAERMIAGGVEACMTPYTAGSLRKLGILSSSRAQYPLRSGEPDRDGTVLSEGAALFALETESAFTSRCNSAGALEVAVPQAPGPKPQAHLADVAMASESTSLTGVTETGEGLQQCLRAILSRNDRPDLIVGHLPGTVNGDAAECAAYRACLPEVPVTALKWSTGHMLGASPGFALAMALEMMRRGVVPGLPFATEDNIVPNVVREPREMPVQSVLICALGFGGNAAAVLVRKR